MTNNSNKLLPMTGDDIAAGIGGSLLAAVTSITMENTMSVMFFACIGGFAGVFAKKSGELIWNIGLKKVKKIFNKNNMNE